jgi:hypothetical protein
MADVRARNPEPRHFVVFGALPVVAMWAKFGVAHPLWEIDYSRVEVVQYPILFGLLFALPLGWVTTIAYERCIRASLTLAAGFVVCARVIDQVVEGFPMRALFMANYPILLFRGFLILFVAVGFVVATGFLVVIGASLGYWLSGIVWIVRRRRSKV